MKTVKDKKQAERLNIIVGCNKHVQWEQRTMSDNHQKQWARTLMMTKKWNQPLETRRQCNDQAKSPKSLDETSRQI